jgi:hypothetical protein
MSGSDPVQDMLALEALLLHGDYSADAAVAEQLLADDFREVHAAGAEAGRAAVLAWLRSKDPAARWEFSDFAVQEAAPGVRLVTYHAQQVAPQRSGSKGARHISVWRTAVTPRGWQLCFHQATKVL